MVQTDTSKNSKEIEDLYDKFSENYHSFIDEFYKGDSTEALERVYFFYQLARIEVRLKELEAKLTPKS